MFSYAYLLVSFARSLEVNKITEELDENSKRIVKPAVVDLWRSEMLLSDFRVQRNVLTVIAMVKESSQLCSQTRWLGDLIISIDYLSDGSGFMTSFQYYRLCQRYRHLEFLCTEKVMITRNPVARR